MTTIATSTIITALQRVILVLAESQDDQALTAFPLAHKDQQTECCFGKPVLIPLLQLLQQQWSNNSQSNKCRWPRRVSIIVQFSNGRWQYKNINNDDETSEQPMFIMVDTIILQFESERIRCLVENNTTVQMYRDTCRGEKKQYRGMQSISAHANRRMYNLMFK